MQTKLSKLIIGSGAFAMSAGLAIGLIACGGGSGNNQGVSFSLNGFYDSIPASSATTTTPTGVVGLTCASASESDTSGCYVGDNIAAVIGVQNNLAAQTIRLQRVYFDYIVEGSDLAIPQQNYPLNNILGPAAGGSSSSSSSSGTEGGGSNTNGEGATSSLPSGASSLASVSYLRIPLVDATILELVNANRQDFPDHPNLIVTVTVRGITSSGNVIDTNSESIFVQLTEENPVSGGGSSSSSSSSSSS